MKKIRMGFIALAAIAGVGGAYATSHKTRLTGTVYYSQKINSTQSVWRAVQPGTACQPSALDCTITSTSANVTSLPPNTYPAQFTVVNNAGKSHGM
ncbi:hypothetical protein [Mucilaginibacter sp. PAMB04168]|uniref:hypothetical protein n=1 Tax=Mucilaginibacter sp. PAMB04168 TaxID=3138567 RepID=UPI0031F5FEF0